MQEKHKERDAAPDATDPEAAFLDHLARMIACDHLRRSVSPSQDDALNSQKKGHAHPATD